MKYISLFTIFIFQYAREIVIMREGKMGKLE
jgi:hypothetical protein